MINQRIAASLAVAVLGIFGLSACEGGLDDAKYAGPQSVELAKAPQTTTVPELSDDEKFIALLQAKGLPFPGTSAEDIYIEMADSICGIIRSYGYTGALDKVQAVSRENGFLTRTQTSILVNASQTVYCPQTA